MSPGVYLAFEGLYNILYYIPIAIFTFDLHRTKKQDAKKLILTMAIIWLSIFVLNRPNEGSYISFLVMKMTIIILAQMSIFKHNFNTSLMYTGLCYLYTAVFSMFIYYAVIMTGLNQNLFIDPRWMLVFMPGYYLLVYLTKDLLFTLGNLFGSQNSADKQLSTLIALILCMLMPIIQFKYVTYESAYDPYRILDYLLLFIVIVGGYALILQEYRKTSSLRYLTLYDQNQQVTTVLLESYSQQMHEYKNALSLSDYKQRDSESLLLLMHVIKMNKASEQNIELILKGDLTVAESHCLNPQNLALIYGILLDNAIDYLSEMNNHLLTKHIYLEVSDTGLLSIRNLINPKDKIEVEKLFEAGFSSKNSGLIKTRGYGLYNAKLLSERSGIFLDAIKDGQYINFTLQFPCESILKINAL